MAMTEIWRPVVGAEDHYEVSNFGNVRSLERVVTRGNGRQQTIAARALKTTPDKVGRLSVQIGGGNKRRVHQLVAEAFIGPRPSPAHEVAHFDGDPANNFVENLRWATRLENAEDRDRHGRTARGSVNGNSRFRRELAGVL